VKKNLDKFHAAKMKAAKAKSVKMIKEVSLPVCMPPPARPAPLTCLVGPCPCSASAYSRHHCAQTCRPSASASAAQRSAPPCTAVAWCARVACGATWRGLGDGWRTPGAQAFHASGAFDGSRSLPFAPLQNFMHHAAAALVKSQSFPKFQPYIYIYIYIYIYM